VSVEAAHDIRIGSHVLMAPFASVIDDDSHRRDGWAGAGMGGRLAVIAACSW
jgi:hypothetical protein